MNAKDLERCMQGIVKAVEEAFQSPLVIAARDKRERECWQQGYAAAIKDMEREKHAT